MNNASAERIYGVIRDSGINGATLSLISARLGLDFFDIRDTISSNAVFSDLCYKNSRGNYCAIISGAPPSSGFDHFSSFSLPCSSFIESFDECMLRQNEAGGGNVSAKDGIFNFAKSSRREKIRLCTMRGFFTDIERRSKTCPDWSGWEIVFDVSLNMPKNMHNIKNDVLVIGPTAVYPIDFVNLESLNGRFAEKSTQMSASYRFLFGKSKKIDNVIVLEKAHGFYKEIGGGSGKNQASEKAMDKTVICSRDLMYRVYGNVCDK